MHQGLYPGNIVGHHCQTIVEHMVNGDQGNAAVHQLPYLGIAEVHTGDHNAVHAPVLAVLKVAEVAAASVIINEGNVVSVALCLHLEALQHCGEILVGQAAVLFVHKEDAQIVGAVGFQCPCCGIGHVAHFLSSGTDPGSGLLADVGLTVQRLAHCGNRHTAALGNIFH